MRRGELGDALARRMRDRGILQREAAAELGTQQQTLSKWMNGVHRPSPEAVPQIARFLDCSEEEVRAMIPPVDPAARMSSSRRLDELEQELADERAARQRQAMRMTTLSERIERLEGSLQEIRDRLRSAT